MVRRWRLIGSFPILYNSCRYVLGREGVGVLSDDTAVVLWALLSVVTHGAFAAAVWSLRLHVHTAYLGERETHTHPFSLTTLPKVDTNCTALSLMPTIIGDTFAASLHTDICPQRKEARPRLTL